jgi:hypothetical protein
MARIGVEAGTAAPGAAICLAGDTEARPIHIAPGKNDRQHVMEGGTGHSAADEEAAPDQRANALHHHTPLVDTGGEVRGWHGRSVSKDRRAFTLVPPRISRSRSIRWIVSGYSLDGLAKRRLKNP